MAAANPRIIPGVDQVTGSIDAPLTERGQQQARELGQQSAGQVSGVASSPMRRAQMTAQEIAAANPGARAIDLGDALAPWALGALEGQPEAVARPEIARLMRNPNEKAAGQAPGSTRPGESFNQYRNRFVSGLERLKAEYQKDPGQTIVASTHSRGLSLAKSYVAGGMKDLAQRVSDSPDPGEMYRMYRDGGKWKIEAADDFKQPGVYLMSHHETPFNKTEGGTNVSGSAVPMGGIEQAQAGQAQTQAPQGQVSAALSDFLALPEGEQAKILGSSQARADFLSMSGPEQEKILAQYMGPASPVYKPEPWLVHNAPVIGGAAGGILGDVPGAALGGALGQTVREAYQQFEGAPPPSPAEVGKRVAETGVELGALELLPRAVLAGVGRLAAPMRGAVSTGEGQAVKDLMLSLPGGPGATASEIAGTRGILSSILQRLASYSFGGRQIMSTARTRAAQDMAKDIDPRAAAAYQWAKAFYREGAQIFDSDLATKIQKTNPENVVSLIGPDAPTDIIRVRRALTNYLPIASAEEAGDALRGVRSFQSQWIRTHLLGAPNPEQAPNVDKLAQQMGKSGRDSLRAMLGIGSDTLRILEQAANRSSEIDRQQSAYDSAAKLVSQSIEKRVKDGTLSPDAKQAYDRAVAFSEGGKQFFEGTLVKSILETEPEKIADLVGVRDATRARELRQALLKLPQGADAWEKFQQQWIRTQLLKAPEKGESMDLAGLKDRLKSAATALPEVLGSTESGKMALANLRTIGEAVSRLEKLPGLPGGGSELGSYTYRVGELMGIAAAAVKFQRGGALTGAAAFELLPTLVAKVLYSKTATKFLLEGLKPGAMRIPTIAASNFMCALQIAADVPGAEFTVRKER